MEASGDLGAKSSHGSWETTVGVRGDKWLKKTKQLYMSRKTYSVTSEWNTIWTFWAFPPQFLISLSTGKDWSKSQSTLCSFALPIPNELTFSPALFCCSLRHFSLNKLFSGITVALFYLHWFLGTTFSLLLISLCVTFSYRWNTGQLYTKFEVHLVLIMDEKMFRQMHSNILYCKIKVFWKYVREYHVAKLHCSLCS